LTSAAYPHPAADVRMVQTHISWVLLAGDYAYKIKKPVDFGFVDYSTLERRRVMCEEEVRLNRRLCHRIYLGVAPISRDASGIVAVGGRGEVVEYAVQMTRVPESAMMPSLLETGAWTDDHLRALAERLARFHGDADAGASIAPFGGVDAIAGNWEENFEQVDAYIGRTITREQQAALRRYVHESLQRRAVLFAERVRAGRIRDCHGDLRADSVALLDDGSICIMDCIEFNERFRYGDVASDVAFLAMDLEFRGYRRASLELVSAYLERARDETLTAVLDFYRAYRACIRGKVESMLLDEKEIGDEQKEAAEQRARRYFELALSYTERHEPVLVIMSGLSGSGKSYAAAPLAGALGAALVRSDDVRRSVDAAAAPAAYGEGAYASEGRERVYDAMLKRAAGHLEAGLGVVLDATFGTRRLRGVARGLAAEFGVRFLAVEVIAAEEVIRARMEARESTPGASDARWDTYLAQRDRFEPLDELAESERTVIDSSVPLDATVDRVMRFVSKA
jgi:aminoglycoside phosphotransferase family enzyme/predicted kinase